MTNINGRISNALEQIDVRMPRVTAWLSGDSYMQEKDLQGLLGGEELELTTLQRFVNTGEGLHYYIDLDISASISHEEFRNICRGLQDFAQSLRSQDQLTLITFGDEVHQILSVTGEQIRGDEEVQETLAALRNEDQHTLFFEALDQTAQMIEEEQTADEGARSVLCVITDGEDVAQGKATKEEALARLQQAGLPLYAFTTDETANEYLNSLGAFARNTGGSLRMFVRGREGEGLRKLHTHLLRSYQAIFMAQNNLVTNETKQLTLHNERTGATQRRAVLQSSWIADTQAPEISCVVRLSDNQLQVTFSEPVRGITAAGDYRVVRRESGETGVPAAASPETDQTGVLLTFTDTLDQGEYSLSVTNVTDISMEKNPLTQPCTFSLGKSKKEIREEERLHSEVKAHAAVALKSFQTDLQDRSVQLAKSVWTAMSNREKENGSAAKMEAEMENALTGENSRAETAKETGTMSGEGEREESSVLSEEEKEEVSDAIRGEETESETLSVSNEETEELTEERITILPTGQTGITGAGLRQTSPSWLPVAAGGTLIAALLAAVLAMRAGKRRKETTAVRPRRKDSRRITMTVNGSRRRLQIDLQDTMIVGNSSGCDLRFTDPQMAEQHFALGLEQGKILISALSRSKPTFVNGERIGTAERILRSGDAIQAGALRMELAWN